MNNPTDMGDIREKLGKIIGLQEAGNSNNTHRFNDMETRFTDMRGEMNTRFDRLHDRVKQEETERLKLEKRVDKTYWTAAGVGAGAGLSSGILGKLAAAIFGIFK